MNSKMFPESSSGTQSILSRCADHKNKINHQRLTRDDMTIDNKHNFADAEVLLDDEYFPIDDAEPIAQAVLVDTTCDEIKIPFTAPSSNGTHVTNFNANNNPPTENQNHFPDMTANNEQHKHNVARGVITGVIIGGILLGPIGAIAGGFIGSSIVNGRERRWHYRRRGFHAVDPHRMNHHRFTGTRDHCGRSSRCHGRWH
jgi:hypothetical protein